MANELVNFPLPLLSDECATYTTRTREKWKIIQNTWNFVILIKSGTSHFRTNYYFSSIFKKYDSRKIDLDGNCVTRMRSSIRIHSSLTIKKYVFKWDFRQWRVFFTTVFYIPCILTILLPSLKFHAWWEWHRSRATTVKRCRSQWDEGRNRNLDPPESFVPVALLSCT